MHFLQAINSDISVLIVCNKTGGTIKGDIKKTVGGNIASAGRLVSKPNLTISIIHWQLG